MTGFYFIVSACAFAPYFFELPMYACVQGCQKFGNNFTNNLQEIIAMQGFPSGRLFGPVSAFMKMWEQAKILKRKYERIYFALVQILSCG